MKRSVPAIMEATSTRKVTSDNESDSDWEAVSTPTPPESPAKHSDSRPVISNEPRRSRAGLTFVKTQSEILNDLKVQQLLDDFDAFDAESEEPRSEENHEGSLAQFEIDTWEGAVRSEEERGFQSSKVSRDSTARINVETVDSDIALEDTPSEAPEEVEQDKPTVDVMISSIMFPTLLMIAVFVMFGPPATVKETEPIINGLLLFILVTMLVRLAQFYHGSLARVAHATRQQLMTLWQAIADDGEKDSKGVELITPIVFFAWTTFAITMLPVFSYNAMKRTKSEAKAHEFIFILGLLLVAEVILIVMLCYGIVLVARQPAVRQKLVDTWQAVRQKLSDTWQAFRDSLQEEEEEVEEQELTEGDKQLRQAWKTIADSMMLPAIVLVIQRAISPWYKITIHPVVEYVVLLILGSMCIYALSQVNFRDTAMARELAGAKQKVKAMAKQWMPEQQVVHPNNTAAQSVQASNMLRLCDGFIGLVLDMVLKAILAAFVGYIVLPVENFGEIRYNSTFMAVCLVLMVKTPRLPVLELATAGLLWASDSLQPYIARFTAAMRQQIGRSGKYITDNKQVWLANGKRFGKMACDALLWTASQAGRIMLACIFLQVVLSCLHAYQSRHSVGIQHETLIASDGPDLGSLQALELERLIMWSDFMALTWQDLQTEFETERESKMDQEPQRPEPSDMGSKEHIFDRRTLAKWLKSYYRG